MNNSIETETWHDQRPTHSSPPAIVTEAREAAARAWKRVSDLADEYDQGEEYRDPKDPAIDEAIDSAKAADAWYRDVYAAWQRGDEGAIACYCTPTGDTCENCKRQVAAHPDGVYGF